MAINRFAHLRATQPTTSVCSSQDGRQCRPEAAVPNPDFDPDAAGAVVPELPASHPVMAVRTDDSA